MENIDNYILDEQTLAEHYKESGNTYGYERKMTMLNGNAYCDSVPCSLKNEVPKKTNADKIRSMNDEELAEFLCHLDYSDGSIWNGDFWIGNGEELLKWLQSEAE